MSTRAQVLTLPVGERLVTETCYSCGVLFAMAEDFFDHRQSDQKNFYCPAGHQQHYVGKSDRQKLDEAAARETALRDQLEASIRDGETQRVELARIRQRIANGVCPCCNRSFGNVRQHMANQHPDYAVDLPAPAKAVRFECGCGLKFKTYLGLRIHQGKSRPDDWARPGTSRWHSHLTVGASR